jgi:hypothetical protein
MFRRQQPHSMPISSSVKRLATAALFTTSRSAARPSHIPKQWHAISVEAKSSSCAVAQDLRKQRFLLKEAPKLPLQGCSKGASCLCTYKHHDDRRSKPRRKEGASVSSNGKAQGSERRTIRGRRSDD